jgi:tetratricopeptide (TPR) repeat protein
VNGICKIANAAQKNRTMGLRGGCPASGAKWYDISAQRGSSKVFILEKRPKLPLLPLGALLFLISLSSACLHAKAARINVSEPDIKRANEALIAGDLASNRKDHYAALVKYLEAARYNPNNENLHNRLGIAYAQLKYYDEAIASLERAIKLNPKFSIAFNTLGSVYFLQKKYNKSEKYFKKAIHLDAHEETFHVNLGNLYLERKKPKKAIAEWRKALALNPQALTSSSAVILTGTGRTGPAERIYLIAAVYASEKKVELAIDSLKQAVAKGFSNLAAIENNTDFDPIREDPRFIKFTQSMPLMIELRDKASLPEGAREPSPLK